MSSLNIKKWKSNKNIKLLFKIFKKDKEETRFSALSRRFMQRKRLVKKGKNE